MKPVIIGPSFESAEEPDNHPLSDFKVHFLIDVPNDGYSSFPVKSDQETVQMATVCFGPDKLKPPLFQREIDKMEQSSRKELINVT